MPRLIQFRPEFRLSRFFKWLTADGPYVDIETDIGHFVDEASARQKAQALLAENPRLAFAIRSDTDESLAWIADSKTWHSQESRHRRIGKLMQFITLVLLGWLAVGGLNDGLFTKSTLMTTGLMAGFFLLFSFLMNQVETIVVWVVVLTLALLAIPTYRIVREKAERQRALNQPAESSIPR